MGTEHDPTYRAAYEPDVDQIVLWEGNAFTPAVELRLSPRAAIVLATYLRDALAEREKATEQILEPAIGQVTP